MKMNSKLQYGLLLLSLFISSLVYATDDSLIGKRLYDVYCIQCHGVDGDGYGINVPDMDVLPKDHTDREGMINRTDDDIFNAIKFGGKSVSKSILMPNWDLNLSDDEIRLLVSHIRSLCCLKEQE